MSGRKSSEVAAVIEALKGIIQAIHEQMDSKMDQIEKEIQLVLQESNSLIARGQGLIFLNFPNAQKEFKDEYENLKSRFNKLKTSLVKIDFSEKIRSIKEDNKAIDREIEKNNNESDTIRASIRNKSHYCNSEYTQAQNLKKSYEELKIKKHNNSQEITDIYNVVKNSFFQQKEIVKSMEDLIKEGNSLELRGKDISEKRERASELKKDISIFFDDIDSVLGNKFKKDEYSRVKALIDNFNRASDVSVISSYSKVSKEISILKQSISEIYSVWLFEKNSTESYLERVLNGANSKNCIEPMDKFRGVEEDKISVFDYEGKYSETSGKSSFDSKIKLAKQLLQEEKFSESKKIISESEKIYGDSYKNFMALEEKTLKLLSLTSSMRDVMNKNHFNTNIELRDGVNMANGFKMTCKNGDTIIFDNISYDEEKGFIIELDHQEGTSNTCHVRWKDIQKDMNSVGVPMTDVKKNGNSVLYSQKMQQKQTVGIQQQSH